MDTTQQTVSSRDDVAKLGTILGIWAHPDDETFTMGGILAAAAKNGQRIIIVTATKGEQGIQDELRWPAERLGAIREAELHDAMTILGIKEHELLGYPDGGCENVNPDEATFRIAELIRSYKPNSIFTFGPEGLTGHPDHQAVSQWAAEALKQSGHHASLFYAVQTNEQYARTQTVDNALNFFYNTPKPPTCDDADAAICVHLDNELIEIKKRALAAMPSQYQRMFEQFDDQAIEGCFDVEAFVLG